MIDSPFRQPVSRCSLVFLLALELLHTPCISSPNHHLLFAAHAHTIAASSAVIPMLSSIPNLSLCHSAPYLDICLFVSVLFILYTADLISLIESHGLTPHLYADNTQVCGSCPASNVDAFSVKLTACSCAVASWMQSNRFQLNSDKTEVLWCATTRRQHQLPRSRCSSTGPRSTQFSRCVIWVFSSTQTW